MAVVVDTIILLQLIHDGFAASKEKDDELFSAAQSLLSVLTFHLRHPLAQVDERHGETIRFLEREVAAARERSKAAERTGSAG